MVKMQCRIELYDPNPDRQAEIDKNIKEQANKAEQEVYERIGRNYFDIIKEWGEVPPAIKSAALILTSKGLFDSPFDDGNTERMLLQPYKKQKS